MAASGHTENCDNQDGVFLQLMPFQREGVARGMAMGGRLLLGDEMGLGKTIQAIAIAKQFEAEWPLLVCCPTSLALPWAEELERWCPSLVPGEINLVKSHHNGGLRSAKVTILTYGLVTNGKERQRIAASVAEVGFQVVIADEAHYLKSKDAQRSKLLLPIFREAPRCILLTGTPALSRPVELWTLISTVAPQVPEWATYKQFVERYCDAKMVVFGRGGRRRRYDVSGWSNCDELYSLLAKHAMVRRTKAEVLTQLPAKRRQRILVSLPDGPAVAELRELGRQLQGVPMHDEWNKRQLLSEMCNSLGIAKAAAAAEYALELLQSCGKILFFAHHRAMLDEVERSAAGQGVTTFRIDGSVPAAERAALVSRFQSSPASETAIFLLSIQAGGQGLTLTAASTVVFGELSWVPGELLQAEDRAHRFGQKCAVSIHYLVVKETADEIMWNCLQRKIRTLGSTLDGLSKQRLKIDDQQIWGLEEQLPSESAVSTTSANHGQGVDTPLAGGVALDHTARKAERERLAQIERRRCAFKSLFGAAAEARRSKKMSGSMPLPLVDLTNDEDADELNAAEITVESHDTSIAPRAWFAVSSLTGRIHCFGSNDAPLTGGIGANALLHDILEDGVALPAPLLEPSLLASARHWVEEYLGLTSAQRAALADRPLRVPLLGSTSHAVPDASPVEQSTVRETNSDRWAAAHKPAEDHETRTWQTSSTITSRTWTQHFSKSDGRPHCLYCLSLHTPQPDSPFCSEKCAFSYSAAATRGSARRQLFDRDLGVCQKCGFDAHSFCKKMMALPTPQAKMQALMSSPYSTLSGRFTRMLATPTEGDYWEADHIRPVAEGGGESSLDNFQTLCTPCHVRKTKEQADAKVRHKRKLDAEGTADLRQFFHRPIHVDLT